MKKCTKCKVKLTNKNWYFSSRKSHYYKCKKCSDKESKIYILKHKKEVKKHQKRYRKEHSEELQEYMKRYYIENNIDLKERNKKYYLKNRRRCLKLLKEWNKKHPGYCKNWNRVNKDRKNFLTRQRHYKKYNAKGNHTFEEWLNLCKQYNHKCLRCRRKKKLTEDHIIPLSKGGSNFISNIQPLCSSCNSSKGTQTVNYKR